MLCSVFLLKQGLSVQSLVYAAAATAAAAALTGRERLPGGEDRIRYDGFYREQLQILGGTPGEQKCVQVWRKPVFSGVSMPLLAVGRSTLFFV